MTKTLMLTLVLLAGCATQPYVAQPVAPHKATMRFEQRSLDSPDLRDFMISQGYPENGFPIKTWDLPALTLAAFFFHPQLEVARAEWRLAQAGQISAGQKINPSLTTSIDHHSIAAGGVSPWTFSFAFGITVETGGKRAIRQAHAALMTDAARMSIAATAWNVRSQLRQQWIEYQGTLQGIELLKRELALRDEMVQLLQRRLDAGMVSSVELQQMRMLAQQARQALAAEQGRLSGLQASLGEVAGLPAQTLESAALSTLMTASPRLPDAALQRAALTNRLDLLSALVRYAAAESVLELEIAKQIPDITLVPGYSYDQGDNRWSLGLSTIPNLLNHNEGPIAEARARRELEAEQFYALQIRVIGELDHARASYQEALNETIQAERLLDAQRQREVQLEQQFAVGYSDQLDQLGVRLETLRAEKGVLTAQRQTQRVSGLLEDAIGRPLDDAATTKDLP